MKQGLAKIGLFPFGEWEKSLPKRCFVERDSTIVDICREKSVLHVGAADAPFHMEKARDGQLLHQKVAAVASDLIGIDVDSTAVNELVAFGLDSIIVANIEEENALPEKTYDVVLCCDVIEHVDCAGGLLDACVRYLKNDSVLVITTPNATSVKAALRALFGREAVHHEHTCYYSYATLIQLMHRHGLMAVSYGTFGYPTVTKLAGVLTERLMIMAPSVADGIIIVGKRVVP